MTNSISKNVTITLSLDEALVLFEFFARFGDSNEFSLRHNSEFLAFSQISSQLDKALVEPFQPAYVELLEAARSRIAMDYEGLAPGVVNPDVDATQI